MKDKREDDEYSPYAPAEFLCQKCEKCGQIMLYTKRAWYKYFINGDVKICPCHNKTEGR